MTDLVLVNLILSGLSRIGDHPLGFGLLLHISICGLHPQRVARLAHEIPRWIEFVVAGIARYLPLRLDPVNFRLLLGDLLVLLLRLDSLVLADVVALSFCSVAMMCGPRSLFSGTYRTRRVYPCR